MAETFATLKTRFADFTNDEGATLRWSDTSRGYYINDAYRDFCTKTGILHKASAALGVSATTPANAFYTLPTDLVELEGVESNGIWLPRLDLSVMPNNYATVTGTESGYLFGPFGLLEIRVWPTPPSTLTALKVYYTRLPADLTGTDVPAIPAQFHIALVYGAVAFAYLKDFEAKDPAKAQVFMQMYQDKLAEAQGLAARSLDNAPRIIPYRHL